MTVVIPTYDRIDLLRRSIASVLAQRPRRPRLIVVDNGSPASIAELLGEEFGEDVRVVRLERNTFFCRAVNCGIRMSQDEYVAVLNDDCYVESDWTEGILQTFAQNQRIGSVASLVYRAGRGDLVDSAGAHMSVTGLACGIGWNRPAAELPTAPTEVFSAAGACAAYRRNQLVMAGGFDERFVAYFDDVDLGFRLQLRGCRCVFNPACRAHHDGGATHKARHDALFLAERNMIWTLVKNLPSALFKRHQAGILAVQSRPARIMGGSTVAAWATGKAAAVAGLPSVLAERRRIQGGKTVSDAHVEALLNSCAIGVCHL